MVQPNLLHPVPVVVEQIDKTTTYYDDDAREPIQYAARPTQTTVQGQVEWRAQKNEEHRRTGTVEGASGYVLFRRVDLAAVSLNLQIEDRLARIGDIDTDVYVHRLEWVGHYPDKGGPTMVKAYFQDRGPARQTRGV
jgi:hypothetical protein